PCLGRAGSQCEIFSGSQEAGGRPARLSGLTGYRPRHGVPAAPGMLAVGPWRGRSPASGLRPW
ncbi:hypothetical protein, partial [Klebsiella pneumoniae]|uniref:hypothetical protein n=1 Tax=Klebsiella pneumoniae TaxID=573 RepID=UPI0019544EA9